LELNYFSSAFDRRIPKKNQNFIIFLQILTINRYRRNLQMPQNQRISFVETAQNTIHWQTSVLKI
jgi:hypothetical protein